MNKIIKIFEYLIRLIVFLLIYIYKFCISPFIPKTCRFLPTCSDYAVLAVKEYGVFKGLLLAFKRILKCNPKSKCGVDPVPPNIKGEIKWLI